MFVPEKNAIRRMQAGAKVRHYLIAQLSARISSMPKIPLSALVATLW
jgi:hypothetical protein